MAPTRNQLIDSAAVLMLMATLWIAAPAAGQNRRPAAEIRFGVIDPPVIAQRDITEPFTANNTSPTQKNLEASGLACVDGHLVIISDRHGHCAYTCRLDLAEMKIEAPRQHVIIRNEQYLLADAESLAAVTRPDGTNWIYAICSLSNDRTEQSLPMRRHFARFTVKGGEQASCGPATVLDATTLREQMTQHFEKLNIQPYRTYYEGYSGADKNTYRWGNVEGIAFTPDGKRMLCGMRNPLTAGRAIFFAVANVDEAFDKEDPTKLAVTDVFPLDLGSRGVSDLCWDPYTKGFLIAAARSNGPKLDRDQPFPPNNLDCALFWWSGRKSEKPVLFATIPEMKIESICRLGNTRFIAMTSDEADESEGREHSQSIVTVMDFTGFER